MCIYIYTYIHTYYNIWDRVRKSGAKRAWNIDGMWAPPCR